MKMTLTCNVCSKELIQVKKENILQEDKDLYQVMVSCSCELQDINIEITE